MTQIITFSLKNTHKNSDQFFADLSGFTDLILQQAEGELGSMLDAFDQWISESKEEEKRSRIEYIFDLLVLGVLWRVYAPDALGSSGRMQKFLVRLVNARKKYPRLKGAVDVLRGLLGGLFLHGRRPGQGAGSADLQNFDHLIAWLAAVGDFKEEVRRLKLWRQFLDGQQDLQEKLQNILSFADWFETASMDALGKYTPNVDEFLTRTHPGYRLREDYFFTGRQRVEYHLYMVGTEVMNRSFRAQFLDTEQKIIFVPPCMSAPQDGSCQAKDTPFGEVCAHCTPGCQVNQITKFGEKQGIKVFMIPDSFSPLSKGGGDGAGKKSLGVIGVSCPVTITGGGFEMRRLGIPAQGVLLDHCGCSWHWDLGKGIVTEINFRQLTRTLAGDK